MTAIVAPVVVGRGTVRWLKEGWLRMIKIQGWCTHVKAGVQMMGERESALETLLLVLVILVCVRVRALAVLLMVVIHTIALRD